MARVGTVTNVSRLLEYGGHSNSLPGGANSSKTGKTQNEQNRPVRVHRPVTQFAVIVGAAQSLEESSRASSRRDETRLRRILEFAPPAERIRVKPARPKTNKIDRFEYTDRLHNLPSSSGQRNHSRSRVERRVVETRHDYGGYSNSLPRRSEFE